MAAKELLLTITVSGQNLMGQPLCRVNGVLYGYGDEREINYVGPVKSAEEVADAIAELFTEPR